MNLNQTTNKNIKWSFIESISLKLVGFVLSIILARLLTPEDFGILAIVNVFYLVTVLFVDGGLREALIQKKQATQIDYSTMFWLNLGMSCLIYIGLFIAAPYIESLYEYDNLSFFIRLQSIILIIESFGLIQIVKATRDLDLKKITLARIPASIFSFIVGISMAYLGFGVISLIVQQLVNGFIYTSLLVFKIRYVPIFTFNKNSFKSLFAFGSKMIAISYLSRFYVQSLNLIFAFFYNPALLGLYTKSRSLQGVPIEVVNTSFVKGLYPTMVKVQKHDRLLRKIFLKNIRRLTLFMVLINGILFFNAHEIILILLGEKWIEMTIYLKIAAVGSILFPVNTQVINILKARGNPGIILKIEFFIKSISLGLIIILSTAKSFPLVLWSLAVINLVSSCVFLYFCSKKINFLFSKEFFKLLLPIIYHIITGYFIFKVLQLMTRDWNDILKIFLFILFYFTATLIFTFIFKDYSLKKYFEKSNKHSITS